MFVYLTVSRNVNRKYCFRTNELMMYNRVASIYSNQWTYCNRSLFCSLWFYICVNLFAVNFNGKKYLM